MKSVKITITTSPTVIFGGDDKNRWCRIHNKSGGAIYIGHDNVTAADGFLVDNGENVEIFMPSREMLYGVTSGGTSDLMTLTPDVD